MIELIARGKFPLTLRSPVLPAPGVWSPDSPLPLDALGALVTPPLGWIWDGAPVELRLRPGGIVWEPPRRPLERFVQRLARERVELPVIVTLAADEPRLLADAVSTVESEIEVQALLIWWRPPFNPAELVAAAHSVSLLPLLVEIPADLAITRSRAVIAAGADAVVIGPPRALLEAGLPARLWGPAVLPMVERALDSLVEHGVNRPLIAAGGVASGEDALRLYEAGAEAIAVGPEWWVEPDLAGRVVMALAEDRSNGVDR